MREPQPLAVVEPLGVECREPDDGFVVEHGVIAEHHLEVRQAVLDLGW